MFEHDENVRIRAAILVIPVALMWFIHAMDALLPRGFSAAGMGIVPRTVDGLYGILTAPFIHANWGHLLANSLPLLILGAIVLLRGVTEYFFVVLTSILIGGAGTWLFGTGDTQHIGASGVVFGFFGYLVFRTAFDRRLASAAITLAVALAYGSAMAWSLIPAPHISWSGHFFGFVGGVVAARLRYPYRVGTDRAVTGAGADLPSPRPDAEV